MLEDEKKEVDPMFTEELSKCASVVYKMRVLGNFYNWCSLNFFIYDFGTNVPKFIFVIV